MDNDNKDNIRNHLKSLSIEELKEIYEENDSEIWTEEALILVSQLLKGYGELPEKSLSKNRVKTCINCWTKQDKADIKTYAHLYYGNLITPYTMNQYYQIINMCRTEMIYAHICDICVKNKRKIATAIAIPFWLLTLIISLGGYMEGGIKTMLLFLISLAPFAIYFTIRIFRDEELIKDKIAKKKRSEYNTSNKNIYTRKEYKALTGNDYPEDLIKAHEKLYVSWLKLKNSESKDEGSYKAIRKKING